MKNDYRIEGLTRRTEEIISELKNEGLMTCDLEVIGNILSERFKGENERMAKLLGSTSKVIDEATELLIKLNSEQNG